MLRPGSLGSSSGIAIITVYNSVIDSLNLDQWRSVFIRVALRGFRSVNSFWREPLQQLELRVLILSDAE